MTRPLLGYTGIMRLFDDGERTYEGRIDEGESFRSFLNRSAHPLASKLRDRCNDWLKDYSSDASEDDLKDFLARFSSNRNEQFSAASFELIMHQMLVRLGFSVSIHPDLHGSGSRPDFAATSDGSRILVEATVVNPHSHPSKLSPFERDVQHKLLRLELADFFASIDNIEGTLDRFLTRNELEREFRGFFNKHDPQEVSQLLDRYGDCVLPTRRFRFGDWALTVRLWPGTPGLSSEGRVIPWSLDTPVEPSVPHIQTKIKKKKRNYGQTATALVLAVNVHALEFSPMDHGRQILFDAGGIWNPRRLSRSTVTAIVFFAYADLVSAPNTQACLFVKPTVNPDTLPPALLRLPCVHGRNGSERKDGESVAGILGFD